MTNESVVEAWSEGRKASAAHLRTDGFELYSYALCIGTTTFRGEKVGYNYRAPGRFVSKTTSSHVRLMAEYADRLEFPPECKVTF